MGQVKEKPILFSAPMVRAILEGRKTQTRRVVKFLPEYPRAQYVRAKMDARISKYDLVVNIAHADAYAACPYGRAGDRLWVREAWADVTPAFQSHDCEEPKIIAFRADDAVYETESMAFLEHRNDSGIAVRKWKPSIFLPRYFSRITLEITDVRVERLQDISLEDAQCEGVEIEQVEQSAGDQWLAKTLCHFITGWDALNAKRGYSWASNPWVWVISFQRTKTGASPASIASGKG